MRVSEAFWEMAGPLLYSNLIIKRTQPIIEIIQGLLVYVDEDGNQDQVDRRSKGKAAVACSTDHCRRSFLRLGNTSSSWLVSESKDTTPLAICPPGIERLDLRERRKLPYSYRTSTSENRHSQQQIRQSHLAHE
jgi:hypothetical protein